jgi:acyl-CoA synthetase (AMP-forming)/AMP-acid ligase II
MMSGYLNMPEVTNEALKGGYFYSGDLATTDEQGYMYVLERKKDAIVGGGKTIASSDVESVIYSHPSVSEAAVIGVPHAEVGQAVMAVVALKEGKEATAEDIIEACARNLPPYAVPKSVEFTDKLPRNIAGKVLKHVLRQKYSSQAR